MNPLNPYGDGVSVMDCSIVDAVRRATKEKALEYLTFGGHGEHVAFGVNRCGGGGISVVAEEPNGPSEEIVRHKHVVAIITPDPRLVKLLDGTWRRSLTIEEIFRQFPGPYKVVVAINTGQDRRTIEHPCIVASDPQVMVIGEDGHNEDVVKFQSARGYQCSIVDGCLLMVKP